MNSTASGSQRIVTTLSNPKLCTAHSGATPEALLTHSRDRVFELAVNPNLAAAPSAAGDNMYRHVRLSRLQ
jgi:hypothetical protein